MGERRFGFALPGCAEEGLAGKQAMLVQASSIQVAFSLQGYFVAIV